MDQSFALFKLSENEQNTVTKMLEGCTSKTGPEPKVVLMPTHNIDEGGNLNGFVFQAHSSTTVGSVPFPRDMFHGLAMCECVCTSPDVARLLADPDDCQKKLQELLDSLVSANHDGDAESRAAFSCIPRDIHETETNNHMNASLRRAVDRKNWAVDPPRMLGVFQSHVRQEGGARHHAIFVVCDGGCDAATNEYYNMMLDLDSHATMGEALACEETWWVQKACSRARNRILFLACEKLGLKPRTVTTDIHSHDQRLVVTPVCETLRHDISRNTAACSVQVLNHAVDTTRIQNGILCTMHPCEGIWLFRGALRSVGNNIFGGMFGDKNRCGYFPTHTFPTESKEHPGIKNARKGSKTRYLHFNNMFLEHLQKMGWDRDYGTVELVPIATVSMLH